ncbi:MAG: response regulator [Candidatus Omnitrophica bacterium]|nr:response regulator [Candidatus Omnitrophota bacterium]
MANKKVMIVDDDKEFLEELDEALRLSDFDSIVINNPNLALKKAVLEKPDAILLDLRMPGKSGFLLADEIKNSSQLTGTPIIAMSGYFKKDASDFFSVYGIVDYISKPFDPLEVVSKIEKVLEKTMGAKTKKLLDEHKK